MSNVPADLKYMKSHEWARAEGNGESLVGLTDHRLKRMGDVVYVELPNVGDTVEIGGACAVAESVKEAGDVYAPLSGDIVAVNSALADSPELLNNQPYGEGWIVRIKASNEAGDWEELLDATTYQEQLESEE
ncbi:glycine cleavage system protein GcvH [Streptomyces sp. NPDC018352]|uniref:glycine cleavage system protein GcvH n=1 Tax=Streptomyces sp. NPDC018352 TaxID=3157194 RepID=UPI0033F8BEBF